MVMVFPSLHCKVRWWSGGVILPTQRPSKESFFSLFWFSIFFLECAEVSIFLIFICFKHYLFILNIYLFIWLRQVLGAALGSFDLHCRMLDLQLWHANSELLHVGSSSLTGDQTQVPCIVNMES